MPLGVQTVLLWRVAVVEGIQSERNFQLGERELPRPPSASDRVIKRTIRRTELRQIVPLADTTIYEMEQRGEFPRRFNLSPRCVVWDLAEVQDWIAQRRRASEIGAAKRATPPDVRERRTRPVRAPGPR